MNQKERMLAGLPYKAWMDGLSEERLENKKKIYKYNNLEPGNFEAQDRLIKEILGKTGKNINIEAPFHCDYGYNIEVGENFFANYNLTILDVGKVKIGDNAQIAPNVSIYTAGHPVHPDSRNSGYEYGIAITIGDNVWIGGNTCILPGVTIGNNVVIGAGSVVTKDIPDNVIAAGNPCRIIRKITENDRDFYYRDRRFDVVIEEVGNLIYEVNADTQAKELMEGRRRYREQLATSYAAGEIKARKELSAIIADKDATIAADKATIAADKTTIANLMARIAELEEQNKP